MRTERAFFSCAVVAVAGLLDARVLMAGGYGGSSCTSQVTTPTVVAGPCPVADPTAPVCGTSGDWTGIEYEIVGGLSTDAVSTLITANNASTPSNIAAYPAVPSTNLKGDCTTSNGGGDLSTDLGEYSCHERALKVTIGAITKPDSTPTNGFWVFVKGNKQPLPTSISQKRGYCPIKSAQVMGLGLDIPTGCVSTCGNFNSRQGVKSGELVVWEGCQITKWTDPTTGAFLGVTTDTPGCTVDKGAYPVPEPLTGLMLDGQPVTFGTGDATTGTGSCFVTIVGGVYARVCTH